MTEEAVCALCLTPLSAKELDVFRSNPERFDQQLLCFEHQRLTSACPAVRGQGCKPR